jgi:hypothetical protein
MLVRPPSRGARALTTALATLTLAACGATTPTPPVPRLIEGGGVGDGPISGTLNVYVMNEDTRATVLGATVRVGGSSDPAACSVVTDSTGLAIFDARTCALLDGKVSVTASAKDYAPSTWIGVDAANLTMTIHATTAPDVDSAVVTGTIAGWDGLAAPAAKHNLLGFVGYSGTRTLGDAVNDLAQDKRHVAVTGVPLLDGIDFPQNVCVRNAYVNDCAWRLKTRTGAQAHYAVLLDQDTKGTEDDDSDDTFTVLGWAVKTGLSFTKDHGADGETLTLLADADLQPLVVAFPPAPSGLDVLTGFPMLDLGDDGRIAVIFPALDATQAMTRVPRLVGPLARGRYDFLAKAQDAKDKEQPATLTWGHSVDVSAPVVPKAWLPPPTALTVASGVYGFTPTPGATVHSAELQTMAGVRAWSITIFDGSTSFTLPGVSPDPLPAGSARYVVSALLVPGLDLTNAKFDDLRDQLTALASDELVFSR